MAPGNKVEKVVGIRTRSYLEADKHQSVLLGKVAHHLQMLPNDRDRLHIHPSEMSQPDWCPRATLLRMRGVPEKPDQPLLSLRTNLIFATGHQIHDKWQGWLGDMEVLWGKWRCSSCNEEVFSWSGELSDKCPSDQKHVWKYLEVPLESGKYRMIGHSDGIAHLSGTNYLLEFKSVGPGTLRRMDLLPDDASDEEAPSMFSKITRPMRSHILQAQIYMELARDIGEIESPSQAIIVYEGKADQQVREFVVGFNRRWIEPLLDQALDIVWALDNDRDIACRRGGCPKCSVFEEEV